MPADRFPANSVLVPQWTRVEDGLPEDGNSVTISYTDFVGHRRVAHGFYTAGKFCTELGSVIDTTTHWSPRVGIPLPEEE